MLKPKITPGPRRNSEQPLTMEEFFRTVVFEAENRREGQREQNDASMATPDYWRMEFDTPRKNKIAYIDMPGSTNSLPDSERSQTRPRLKPMAAPTHGTVPEPVSTFPASDSILGSGFGFPTFAPQGTPNPPNTNTPAQPPASVAQAPQTLVGPFPTQNPQAKTGAPQVTTSQANSPADEVQQDSSQHNESLFDRYSPITTNPKSDGLQINVNSPLWMLNPATLQAKMSLEALRHRELDGSALDAGTLLGHYSLGDGSPRTMDFTKVDTTGVTPEQFPGFKEQREALRKKGGGTADLDLKLPYRTQGMQRAGLGHITMTLKGRLTVDDKGWSLDAGLGAEPDYYDFDPGKWGERSYEGEISTRIGAKLKGEAFKINFTGTKPVQEKKSWE